MGLCVVSHSPSAGTPHLPGNPCSTSSVSHSLCCRPWGSGDAMWEQKTSALPPGPAALCSWALMSWHLFPFTQQA